MTMPHELPEPAEQIVRRITRVAMGFSLYVVILWAAWFVAGTALRDVWGLHLQWFLFAALPLVLALGVRMRSSVAHHVFVRASFGGVVFGIGWVALMLGGGHHREEWVLWSCGVLAGGVPACAYAYWLATRAPVREWIAGPADSS